MTARARKKLSQRQVQTISKPGRYADGGGLYLSVDKSGARRWLFIFRWKGKRPEMGLGGFPVVSLAEAREKSLAFERAVRSGINPLELKRSAQALRAKERTFGQVVDEALPVITAGYRSKVHVNQYYSTLSDNYIPHLRSLKITEIEVADVAKDLVRIWQTKVETASRLRGRIERIFDYAEGQGLRSGANPARLSPALKALLGGDQQKVVKHHKAMSYADVPGFYQQLSKRPATSAEAYRFLILTAARVREVTDATWSEINWNEELWIVPAERYKTKKAHTVPLTNAALEILQSRKAEQATLQQETPFIFTNDKGKCLSNGAFTALHKRMGVSGFTTHGFRSSFRDWAGNTTDYARDLAEEALGHIIGNKVERAYRRGIALEKRRQLMTEWGNYCTKGEGG